MEEKMLKLNHSEKRTRQRGKNFSPSEEDILLRLLKPYKPIIDNKKSDAMTCQMKKDAWEQLAQEFTYQTGMPRTWRTLKDKYKNMNTKTKTEGKRFADQSSNQSDDFDLSASSCVSVVYEENGEEENNNNDDTDLLDIEVPTADTDLQDIEVPTADTDLQDTKPQNKDENSTQEEVEPPEAIVPTFNRERSLDDYRLDLYRLQQRFYQSENARSAKRHRLELKNLNLKNQILEMELEERRKRKELTTENPPTITPR